MVGSHRGSHVTSGRRSKGSHKLRTTLFNNSSGLGESDEWARPWSYRLSPPHPPLATFLAKCCLRGETARLSSRPHTWGGNYSALQSTRLALVNPTAFSSTLPAPRQSSSERQMLPQFPHSQQLLFTGYEWDPRERAAFISTDGAKVWRPGS